MDPKLRKIAGAAAGFLAIGGALLLKRSCEKPRGNADSSPGRTARRSRFGKFAVVGKTVTISKPPREGLFAFWRDFANLPAVMDNVEKVEMLDRDRARWTIKAPGETTVTLETEIVQEREGELIAWCSTENSDIETDGRVSFRDASDGPGTEVELIIAWKPPLGRTGQALAKLFQLEPALQARRDLRRFKMLMETGEIATSANRKEAA